MSGFDARLSVTGASIGVPDDNEQSYLEINLDVGIQLPFSSGPDQPPMTTNIGTLRFPFSKKQALDLFGKGIEAANNLPDSKPSTSSLARASSMDEVEAAARRLQEMNKAAKHG